MTERTFDWRPPAPARLEGNRPFLMSVRAESVRTDRPLRPYSWTRRAWLDQGVEGACTGFGAAHALSMSPYARAVTDDLARGFYRGAQRYDQWPGEDYAGSSVLGAMEYLHKETGHLSAYWWARSALEVQHAIAFYGPVEMGSNWYSGMMNVHADGFVYPTGEVVGGHAYALGALDLRNRRVRLDNSWGGGPDGWGWNGSAWLRLDDLTRLLAEDGECAVPRKNRAS